MATRTGIFPTLIEGGKTGYVVDVGDTDSLVKALDSCLINPAEIIQQGQAGREHVCRYYDIRQEAAAIEAVYQKILVTSSLHEDLK